MGFFLSVFIFLMIVAVISFVSNQSKHDSNETIGKVKDWEAPVVVQPVTTEINGHSQATTNEQKPVHLHATTNEVSVEAEQTTSEAVLDAVFAELEKSENVATTTVSLMSAEEEQMLDQLVNHLSIPQEQQEENNSVVSGTEATIELFSSKEVVHENVLLPSPTKVTNDHKSSLSEPAVMSEMNSTIESADVTEPISSSPSPTNRPNEIICVIPESELQLLVARYGAENLKGLTSTPAFGRSGGDEEVMLGRVEKNSDRYFLTHHSSSIEISGEAALFVGEMVIASGTLLNDAFMKLTHIELLSVQEDESASDCFSVI